MTIASTSLVIISHEFSEPATRARAIGIWATITDVAFASGPAFGGILVDTLGWHSIFLINAPAALCIALTVALVHETQRSAQKKLDLAGQLTAIFMIAALTIAFILC